MSAPHWTLENTSYRLICDNCRQETPIETASLYHARIYGDLYHNVGLCPACRLLLGSLTEQGYKVGLAPLLPMRGR